MSWKASAITNILANAKPGGGAHAEQIGRHFSSSFSGGSHPKSQMAGHSISGMSCGCLMDCFLTNKMFFHNQSRKGLHRCSNVQPLGFLIGDLVVMILDASLRI
jgi:hypothetical protein